MKTDPDSQVPWDQGFPIPAGQTGSVASSLPDTLFRRPVVVWPMRARTKPKAVEVRARAKMAHSGTVNPETQATVVWLLLRSSICAQKSNL